MHTSRSIINRINRAARIESLETRQLFSLVVGLGNFNDLLTFDTDRPNVVLDRQAVRGLDRGDRLVGIDYRPATGQLFGIGNRDTLYTIDPISGQATKTADSFAVALSDTASYGVDFNPVVDRLRVVNSDNQNLRINQITGAVVDNDLVTAGVQPDGTLAYAPADVNAGVDPFIFAAAYTNSFVGATTTTLYAIDAATGSLVTIGGVNGTPSPNLGQLNTVGSLGFDVAGVAGFDIAQVNGVNVAFASLRMEGRLGTRLYTIDLATGAATLVDRIGAGTQLRDLAVAPELGKLTALNGTNRLLTFDISRPDIIRTNVQVFNLARGEKLLGIDYRPATGELYAVGRTNRIYNISATTGFATQLGDVFAQDIEGELIGLDFNPVVDRVRLVTSEGQNLRINQLTGALADSDLVTPGLQLDGDLSYADGADPNVAFSAYTQNFAGTTSTTLYGIDFEQDILVTQGSVGSAPISPNTGQLFAVGSLGIDVTDVGGFDIITTAGTDRAVALLRRTGNAAPALYDINLTTGAATLIGNVGSIPRNLRGLSAVI